MIINPLPNGGDPALVGAGPFSCKMQTLQHRRLGNGKIPIVPPEVADLFVTGFAGSLDHIIVPDRCKTPSGAPEAPIGADIADNHHLTNVLMNSGYSPPAQIFVPKETAAGDSQLVNRRVCDPALCFSTRLISVAS